MSTHALVSWYLSASYLLQHHRTRLLSEAFVKEHCLTMIARWDGAEGSRHRDLLDIHRVRSGELAALPYEGYPATVRGAASALYENAFGEKLAYREAT